MKWNTMASVLCLAVALPAPAATDDKMLEFDTMVGVVRPFTGPTNPIRGVPGGGIPWALTEAKGEVRMDGRIEVSVRGLVLAEGARAGINPVAQFKAIVSCLTTALDAAGNPVVATENRSTGLFPATMTGDADIQDVVQLPSPCVAPIVFVTSPGGAWFSATGV